MNIKLILKKHHITLQRFANDIGLSRPTLDAYITQYTKTGSLPKDKYQIIFDKLFSEDNSEQDFLENYSSLKYMVSRDEKIGVLDLAPEKTDTLMDIINSIKNDMVMEDGNPAIYYFINAIVNNYRHNIVMETLAEYFAILNGYIAEEEINQERKGYYANIFKCFKYLSDADTISYVEADYEAFLKRCKEIKLEQQEEGKKFEKSIKKKIYSIFDEYNERGIKLEDVDEQEIIQKLLKIAENESKDSDSDSEE